MTTITQILTDAYRESGIIAIDDTLDADKSAEGLRVLNRMFKSLFAAELGEPLISLNYGQEGLTNTYAKDQDLKEYIDEVYVPSNSRLILNLSAAPTLYLNPNPKDGCRVGIVDAAGNLATYNVILNGNGRTIESASSVTLSTNSLNRMWFYRADTGNWVKVTDLVGADESPLPAEFDDFLTTLIALRINPRHGAESSPEMIEVLKRMRSLFRARYAQKTEKDSELALQWLPSTRRYWRQH